MRAAIAARSQGGTPPPRADTRRGLDRRIGDRRRDQRRKKPSS
jgi:hypothetical protein